MARRKKSAGQKTASGRKKVNTSGHRRRGGRKPGKWELLSPTDITEFREKNGLSRARLAETVGVSTTSIQNWETGRVASLKIQKRLRALIDGKPPPSTGRDSSPSGAGASAPVISTTGEIVAAYLRTRGKAMDPKELTKLVRDVRSALS